jgi:hypothetical protein
VRSWLLLLQSLLMSALLLCPAASGAGDRVLGSSDGDIAKHVWTLWWMRSEALTGESGLLTRLVNFPDGVRLWPIDPLDGILGVLVPLQPVALANALAFVHFTLLGLAAGWLGKQVSGSRLGGYVAGALAQGSAFAAFTLHVGVGELRQYWWLPLGLGCLIRAHETGKWRWFVALGLAGAGATLSCFYHGAFLGIASATWLVCSPPRTARALRGYALALALAAVPSLVAAHVFSDSYGGSTELEALVDPATGATTPDDSGAAASLEDLYLPRSWARERLSPEDRAYTGGRYLGFITVILGLIGLRAAPKRALPWAAVAAIGILFSLGSAPDGDPTQLGAWARWGLPFSWLNAGLARIAEPVNFPARFLAMTMIALPALASLATRWRWTALLVPVAIVEIQSADLVPWPRETVSFPAVAGLTGKGAILDLGLALDDSRASRLLNMSVQMALSSPTQAVPIDRLDRWNDSGARWARALPLTQALTAHLPNPPKPAQVYREDLALIHDRGFERILLTHPSNGLDPEYDSLLTALCGPPQRTDLATLWTLPETTSTPAELAAWSAAQTTRIAALAASETPGHYPTSPALR